MEERKGDEKWKGYSRLHVEMYGDSANTPAFSKVCLGVVYQPSQCKSSNFLVEMHLFEPWSWPATSESEAQDFLFKKHSRGFLCTLDFIFSSMA